MVVHKNVQYLNLKLVSLLRIDCNNFEQTEYFCLKRVFNIGSCWYSAHADRVCSSPNRHKQIFSNIISAMSPYLNLFQFIRVSKTQKILSTLHKHLERKIQSKAHKLQGIQCLFSETKENLIHLLLKTQKPSLLVQAYTNWRYASNFIATNTPRIWLWFVWENQQ